MVQPFAHEVIPSLDLLRARLLAGARPDLRKLPPGTPLKVPPLIARCWDGAQSRRPLMREVVLCLDAALAKLGPAAAAGAADAGGGVSLMRDAGAATPVGLGTPAALEAGCGAAPADLSGPLAPARRMLRRYYR